MRKYAYIIVLALIVSAVYFTSCDKGQKMMEPLLPDAKQVELPPEIVETPSEPEVVAESASTKLAASTELKDPNNDGGDEWVNLERYAPDLLPTLSSTEVLGGPAHLETTIIFVNCTETETSFYWLNHQRNEVLYGKIAPGEACWQPTWEGHVWIVKDAAGNNIALFVAQDETGRALLMDTGTPAPESPPEMVETPPETPPVVEMEPAETVDLHGGMVDIEDVMSTVGLRKIYWVYTDGAFVNDESLHRANPDGSGIETLFDGRPDLEPTFGVRKLVVDSEGGKIYWNGDQSANRGGGMWRANLDGTNLERLTTTQARSFALDLEAGKMYWVTYDGEHMFQRSNLDGSNVEKFETRAIFGSSPSMIAFDPVDRKIYASLWDYPGVSAINTDDLDITSADIEFQLPINSPKNLTLDIEERKIYWVTESSGVYRVNLDGTNRELLLDEGRIAATFDFNTRKIYWASREPVWGGGGQIIWQTNLDGSGTEGLFAVEDSISGIAVEVGPIN